MDEKMHYFTQLPLFGSTFSVRTIHHTTTLFYDNLTKNVPITQSHVHDVTVCESVHLSVGS